jgi:hypothetical protein
MGDNPADTVKGQPRGSAVAAREDIHSQAAAMAAQGDTKKGIPARDINEGEAPEEDVTLREEELEPKEKRA